MTEERYIVIEPNFEDEFIKDTETGEQYNMYGACDLLNKQDKRIQELEGIIGRLNRFNDQLIHENNTFKEQQRAYCNNCELAKTQHEQIQELKQQLKEPTSLLYSFIEHFNKQDYRCDCMDQQIIIEESDVIDFLQEKGLE